MQARSFDYVRPQTVAKAIQVFERIRKPGEGLAGGQSLIPVLKLRLANPRGLVDINADMLRRLRGKGRYDTTSIRLLCARRLRSRRAARRTRGPSVGFGEPWVNCPLPSPVRRGVSLGPGRMP